MSDQPTRPLPTWLRVVHVFIVVNLTLNAAYCGYQVFVALAPDGHIGPLFGMAAELPTDLVVMRRQYALEFWVSFGALAVYLGVTEILPRRLRGVR